MKHIEGNSVDGVVDEFFFYSEISVICRELYIGKSLQVWVGLFLLFIAFFGRWSEHCGLEQMRNDCKKLNFDGVGF